MAESHIHGYASTTSVPQGGVLELHLRTLPAQPYDIEIVNALDPEQVLDAYRGLNGSYYPIPDSAYANGCGWPVEAVVPINQAWPSRGLLRPAPHPGSRRYGLRDLRRP